MEKFRNNPPREIAGSKVVSAKDYKTFIETKGDGSSVKIDMPEPSNVLQWFTEEGTKVSVRPSGTEPKIKFYIEVKGEMGCKHCYKGAHEAALKKIDDVRASLNI